ncbi:arginase [Halalkalibacillus sediminis]|uniref:Arginase n=1 Tax=Halalkalibacillus sediminis TaxID=2018042 RepID=A0A2I0QT85_9BACI|nr:arginase [Halalkalibacillus sediminis]PKR77553.1 arginase [Halalkalibacillus sediminis]
MNKKISILGAPITIAQPNGGVDLGPDAIRHTGLVKRLESLNLTIRDYGNIPVPNNGTDKINPETNLKNLEKVALGNEMIAEKVKEVSESGDFPLILGGDHSIAIGSIAGLHDQFKDLGVIWYDAHADLNSGDTSPSGNIHGMSLGVNIGFGNERLTSIRGKQPKLKPENIVIMGARSIDDGEKELIGERGIKVFTVHDIQQKGIEKVMVEAINYLKDRVDGIHLSLDVDGIDPAHTPGTGTPVEGGPSYRETHYAMSLLHDSNLLTSADVVEVNPLLDEGNKTAEVARDMIAAFLGEKYK